MSTCQVPMALARPFRNAKTDEAGGPCALRARQVHRPPVLMNDALDDGQPKPTSRGPRGEEGVEQAMTVLFGNAGPGVPDGDARPAAVGLLRVVHRDVQLALATHGLHCVPD